MIILFFEGLENITRWWQLKYFIFSPRKLGKIPNLTSIFFQRGWFNHQLGFFSGTGVFCINPKYPILPLKGLASHFEDPKQQQPRENITRYGPMEPQNDKMASFGKRKIHRSKPQGFGEIHVNFRGVVPCFLKANLIGDRVIPKQLL